MVKKAGVTISVSVEASCGIPILGEGKVTVGIEGTYEYNWGHSHTKTFEWTPSMTMDMNPETTIDISAQIMMGILTVPYTATLILEYDGTEDKIETQIKGEYKGVCATKAIITTSKEKPLNTEQAVVSLKSAKISIMKLYNYSQDQEMKYL